MHTRSPNKPKNFKQTLCTCQKSDGNSSLGQEISADDGIQGKRDHYVTSILQTLKRLHRAIQSKRRGMLTSGVVLHDNARSHTTACIRALLEHFYWELFDHPPYSADLASSDYHLFTYLKN
jgi:hypothetical protein